MKVFIPALKDNNPFFDEILKYTKSQFYYGNYLDDIHDYDAILIHWPELIFQGIEPSEEQINLLVEKFNYWKLNMKVIYVLHNERRHKGMTTYFQRLYSLVLKNADYFVHLGKYSQSKYISLFPKATHVYIPHPLYRNFFYQYDKIEARKKLKIPINKKIIIVPGNVRSLEERSLVINAFKSIRKSNYLLLAPNMYKKELNLNFRGRYFIKKILDIKKILEYFYNEEYRHYYIFNYRFVDFETFSLMLSASDLVFIPRIENLNSGNVFLGLTYKKVIVGPAIGNITEFLNKFKFPMFDPKNKMSIIKSLNEGISMTNEKVNFNSDDLKPFEPQIIARQWDNFLENI